MMNKNTMIKEYRKLDKSDKYIIGFISDHKVYATIRDSIFPRYMTYEQASRNGGHNLRLRIRKEFRKQLMRGAWFVCADKDLVASKYNKGEIFEKLITEHFGQEWVKDTLSFADGSDLVVDGIGYQIKLQDATIVNEKTLLNQRRIHKAA